jgi:hypothetical protein
MAAAPQRRTTRRPHLDAAAVPVERALLARADELAKAAAHADDDDAPLARDLAATIGNEFRLLAEELHWVP